VDKQQLEDTAVPVRKKNKRSNAQRIDPTRFMFVYARPQRGQRDGNIKKKLREGELSDNYE
jgi:hypothetical protein